MIELEAGWGQIVDVLLKGLWMSGWSDGVGNRCGFAHLYMGIEMRSMYHLMRKRFAVSLFHYIPNV